MKKLLAIVCLAFMVTPALSRAVDNGGRLDIYMDRIQEATGVHRISGDCISACTMWLGYEGSCVTPSARLWFHGSYELSNPAIAVPESNAMLMAYYSPSVQRIVRTWLETTEFSSAHTLSGRQLIALGVRACR